jgi:transcriptional regulator with GAF, ATPase, and Fis domain
VPYREVVVNSDRMKQQAALDAALPARLRAHAAGHPDPEALDLLLSLLANDSDSKDSGDSSEGNDLLVLRTAAALVERAAARQHQRSGRRLEWLQASVEVTRALLGADTDQALQLVAAGARSVTGAAAASVEIPVGTGDVLVQAYDGPAEVQLRGRRVSMEDAPLYRQVSQTREALLIAPARDDPRVIGSPALAGLTLESVIVAPMMTTAEPLGALILATDNPDQPLTDLDVLLAQDFASHAALVHQFALAQADRAQLATFEGRERLAAQLSSRVVSRLFSIGLTLEGLIAQASAPAVAVISSCIDDLDATVAEIRSAIFNVNSTGDKNHSEL